MAGEREILASYTIPVISYDTALCILPPIEQCEHVDTLRELYDKAFGKWPAHINLIYPFVAVEQLPRAQQQIQAYFQRNFDASRPRRVELNLAGLSRQRHNSTTILQESRDEPGGSLEHLRLLALQALGHKPTQHKFHLTVGQTEDNSMSSLEFLISKVRLLPTLDFEIGPLAILLRERTSKEQSANRMRLWGFIDTALDPIPLTVPMPEYWLKQSLTNSTDQDQDVDEAELFESTPTFNRAAQPSKTFFFDPESSQWVKMTNSESGRNRPASLTISSYNVLVDSEYPPARDRDPLLISTLLSDSAKADIVVLQEVSDDFLSSFLNNTEVQKAYPFTSHAPPAQTDIGPLPSLRNVVLISKWQFRWELVPFHRRHKGAVVAVFDSVVAGCSLAVAGVHLTCGLTDGSVAAKKVQVQNLLNHLTRQYSDFPWIVAGDFNLATSTYTIGNALRDKSITGQTSNTLAAIEDQLSENGIFDAWSVTQDQQTDNDSDDPFDGEEGATFDPRNNILAAVSSGTSQNRPQRYDRILVRPQETFQVIAFNMFGLPVDSNGTSVVPSDHYGVRASLQLSRPSEQLSPDHQELLKSLKVEMQHTPQLGFEELESTLHKHHMLLTEEEESKRHAAFAVLKEAVLGGTRTGDAVSGIPLVMVAVGSFAMKVDTSSSDIDCLCVGSISSKTFFKLARQRLQKAENQGIRILRKVEASTGTMFELSVNGVPMDLQYCPAARVVERWFEFDKLPASDPVFNLSILSLRKLKSYRDLLYIQRTIPDLATFALAYRAIKLWAAQRGIYSSKFGYLGGVQITMMLSSVYKRIAHDNDRRINAADLVATFFHYYANFDWTNDMVYDAFFHEQKPRYHRTAREPMVVLGFHSPNSNIAHTATVPGLQSLMSEFKAAAERLSLVTDRTYYKTSKPAVSWEDFFEPQGMHSFNGMGLGETQFLQTYRSYVSIDIHFWGRTLAKGKSLVGWVESRCLSLVVDIHKIFPNIEVRLWPARLTESRPNDTNESKDYHGCYLIGLQKTGSSLFVPKDYDEREAAKQSLEKVIDRFLSSLRTDEKNYDASTSWVNASLVTQYGVQSQQLRLDDREWGDYAMEIEPDSDNEEEMDEENDEESDLPKLPFRTKPTSTSTPVSSAKLRPASDVLNRLRWDPNLDPADYIIGYEDRFLGAKETGLEKWKTEQTDEEFIPQHRILYFRKKFNDEGDGKGEIVWERATRIDKVFGSGAGAGLQT